MLDQEGVQRILAAVNLPLASDKDPDRASNPDKLLADLEGWQSIFRTGEVQRGRPSDREEEERRIVAAFEWADALLDKYIRKYGALYLLRHRPKRARPPERGQVAELQLRNDLRESPGLNKLIGFKQQKSLSNFENAVGILHDIFICHFGVAYKYTADRHAEEGEPQITGPFIRFAEAVFYEVDATYSRRSIANALDKLRKQNP
jgi:hypothetical protein